MKNETESIWLFFYQTSEVKFLLEKWYIDTIETYLAVIIITFFFGLLLEVVTFSTSYLKFKTRTRNNVNEHINSSRGSSDSIFSDNSFIMSPGGYDDQQVKYSLRALFSLAYFVQLTLAYLIMMIVITFNFLLFLAPIAGMMTGYIILNMIESVS